MEVQLNPENRPVCREEGKRYYEGGKESSYCERPFNHIGRHQCILKDYYLNKPDLALKTWDETDSGSTFCITDKTLSVCVVCGEAYDKSSSTSTKDQAVEICFGCTFWINLYQAKRLDPVNYFVINGRSYYNRNKNPNGYRREGYGFDGSKNLIKRFFADDVIESNDLWGNGTIPSHFLFLFPNDSEFAFDYSDNYKATTKIREILRGLK